jgi:hypothetical protein
MISFRKLNGVLRGIDKQRGNKVAQIFAFAKICVIIF